MKRILVIGQTPPPFGGQAIMIKRMLDGKYKNTRLFHVRMAFSKNMDDMGKFRLGKLIQPCLIVFKCIYLKLRYNIQYLYFPPSGPARLPMLRDVVLLLSVRWLFKKTIFHFHAAGTSELYPLLPWYIKPFYRLAYFNPDVAIQLSSFNPDDATFLHAKSKYIIPNGVEDDYSLMKYSVKPDNEICSILFVGMISESKGILVLIEAIKILKESGVITRVNIVGEFSSQEFQNVIFDKISAYKLSGFFVFKGVLTGKEKYDLYWAADIFCFPTFFESESFGLVAVEAMEFGIPVIISKWRGVQSLIDDGEEGFLIPIQDPQAVADKIAILINDPAMRKELGKKGRARFVKMFTVDIFYKQMDEVFQHL